MRDFSLKFYKNTLSKLSPGKIVRAPQMRIHARLQLNPLLHGANNHLGKF